MTLNRSQIQYIYDLVGAKDIYYKDLRDELTDHIASAAEQHMAGSHEQFEVIVKEIVEEVNPEKIQRLRMLGSLLLPFRAIGQMHPIKTMLIFLTTGLGLNFLTSLFGSLESANDWIAVFFVIVATLPALVSIADQKWKPYKMSFFMSAVLGCHFVTYLLHYSSSFFFESFLLQNEWALIAFYTLGFGMIILTYHAIYQQYKKVKQYVRSY